MIYKIKPIKKLNGTVFLQGAKNSAMKHILASIFLKGKSTIHNIPDITSSTNLLEILKFLGAKYRFLNKNSVSIDTSGIKKPKLIPPEILFHSSAGIFLNTVIPSVFGYFEINDGGRTDSGGDQIGRTGVDVTSDFFKQINTKCTKHENITKYENLNNEPFVVDVKNSLGLSLGAVWAGLLRNGISKIINYSFQSESIDNINFLNKAGAKIIINQNEVIVAGGQKLHPVEYTNMYDKHDFVTFLVASLITESELFFKNIEYEKMQLSCIENALEQMKIKIKFNKKDNTCHLLENKIKDLKPLRIIAREFPDFVTEWQVLFSPLLALISGTSEVIEGYHMDRMKHWIELEKMGAKYEFFKDKNYPEKDGNPKAVKIFGVDKLTGAKLIAKDIRCAAMLILAGLKAEGDTTVIDKEDHIKRGYEDFAGRLKKLGANIRESE